MTPGSLQELLWQLGDMPGAVVPTEHEVFLEFEPPQAQPPVTAPPPAAQAPPDTEIYLAPLKVANGDHRSRARRRTSRTIPATTTSRSLRRTDGASCSRRFGVPPGIAGRQLDTDRYLSLRHPRACRVTCDPTRRRASTRRPSRRRRRDLGHPRRARRTKRSGSGSSRPTAAIRTAVILPSVKPVGYHAWADDHTLALFVLGQPATLQLADTRTGTAVARSRRTSDDRFSGFQERRTVREISFVQRERERRGGAPDDQGSSILRPAKSSALTPAVDGSREADTAWTPDGTLLMVKRRRSLQLETRANRMEGSRVTRTAELVRRDAPGRKPSTGTTSPSWDRLAQTPLIYSPRKSEVSHCYPNDRSCCWSKTTATAGCCLRSGSSNAGFRVEQAHNGLQALERAFDLVPDAILTDLNIPGIDGYELTRRLKTDPRTEHIPILAVTGYAPFTQDPARAERAGCDAVLPEALPSRRSGGDSDRADLHRARTAVRLTVCHP